jgi:hypothetical protein
MATDSDTTTADNIHPIRPVDDDAALDWLRSQPGGRIKLPDAELARRWGWKRQRVGRRLKAWVKDGRITRRGNTVTYTPVHDSAEPATKVDFVPPPVPPLVPSAVPPPPPHKREPKWHGAAVDLAAYGAACALASAAAWFSVKGMIVLFPGAPMSVVAMTVAMEASKLIAAGWLARRWAATPWVARIAIAAFIFGLMVINATGVYAQLVAAHVGERGAATSAIETQDATLGSRIAVQTHNVADLDRRLNQVDVAIEEAAKRGKTNAALSAIEGQRKARAGLVEERKREAGTLVALQAERATVAAKGKQIETEALPIRYVAELIGADTDSEKAIRWLIALMVLCCDPLAIALTAAASARRETK